MAGFMYVTTRHKSISCGSRRFREEHFKVFPIISLYIYIYIYMSEFQSSQPKKYLQTSPSKPDDAIYII